MEPDNSVESDSFASTGLFFYFAIMSVFLPHPVCWRYFATLRHASGNHSRLFSILTILVWGLRRLKGDTPSLVINQLSSSDKPKYSRTATRLLANTLTHWHKSYQIWSSSSSILRTSWWREVYIMIRIEYENNLSYRKSVRWYYSDNETFFITESNQW